MKVWTFVFRCQHLIFIPRFSTKPEKPPKLACFLDSLDYEKTIFTVTSCRTSSTSVEIWQNGPYNVAKPSRMLFWQFRGHVTQPIGRYVHICTDSKKILSEGSLGVYILKNPSERDYLQRGVKTGINDPHTCVTTCIRVIYTPLWPTKVVENRDFCQSHLPYWVTFLRLAQLPFWEQLALPSCQLRGRIDKILCFHPLAHFFKHYQ